MSRPSEALTAAVQRDAEAARAIGLTFGQTMGTVVLPQSFRAVVPPMVERLTLTVPPLV